MHWLGSLYFYVFAALALAGALVTVLAKNPIRSAMGLMGMILSIAGLYIALSAPFLAAVQLIVYAGAVVVLFIFVIMLLGPDATSVPDGRGRISRGLSGGLFLVGSLGSLVLVLRAAKPLLLPKVTQEFGTIDAFSHELFTSTLAPFELSSALLMVAVLGAVSIGKGAKGDPAHAAQVKAQSPQTQPPQAPALPKGE